MILTFQVKPRFIDVLLMGEEHMGMCMDKNSYLD